tara:strand:+ start:269 stop:577 length:309 start_codon:yes stop_codon:yes gene_type:complete
MAEQAEKKFQVRRASVGGSQDTPLRRFYRESRHLNQNKTRFVPTVPTDDIGREGDIVFFENKDNFNKVEQFVKHEGRWINISTGRPNSDSAIVKRWVKAKSG